MFEIATNRIADVQFEYPQDTLTISTDTLYNTPTALFKQQCMYEFAGAISLRTQYLKRTVLYLSFWQIQRNHLRFYLRIINKGVLHFGYEVEIRY